MVVKHKERKVMLAENPGARSGSWQTTTAREYKDERCSDLGQLLVQTSTQSGRGGWGVFVDSKHFYIHCSISPLPFHPLSPNMPFYTITGKSYYFGNK